MRRGLGPWAAACHSASLRMKAELGNSGREGLSVGEGRGSKTRALIKRAARSETYVHSRVPAAVKLSVALADSPAVPKTPVVLPSESSVWSKRS